MEIILTNNLKSKLELYFLDDVKRPLILIMPGGGYKYTSERESMPIVDEFHKMGCHAAILKYREEIYYHPQPLFDIAKSIKYLNDNKDTFNITKIGVCGFSAGGHLASCFLVHRYEQYILDHINGCKEDLNVDFSILCYPVITSLEGKRHTESFKNLIGDISNKELMEYMSIEKWVDSSFPKTFIWTTLTDNSVPMESTLYMLKALRDNNVNYEAHIFPIGGHGLSLANETTARNENEIIPYIARWSKMLNCWLDEFIKH